LERQPAILVVAPLSGHFPFLARDLIAGLLPNFRVYITDWVNVRHVPARYGIFGLSKNITAVANMMRKLEPGSQVIGLCQGGVPALAAAALLAKAGDPKMPSKMVLIAAPIDPLANPTKVVQLLRERPISWFEHNLIGRVAKKFAGHGRRVYPAHLRLLPLLSYLTRHALAGTDTGRRVLVDDGNDPVRFPFLDLYTSIMDLDADYFIENTRDIFHDRLMPRNALSVDGAAADPRDIREIGLMTVEGEADDIAAPGQTSAAHRLCSSIPDHAHCSLVVPEAGHFSLFYGNVWRETVLPAIRDFCLTGPSREKAPARALVRRRAFI
jgi:poly(3-hydroxybutyrate) depolymerase